MAVYAVGDIHGCFDEWMELKNRIERFDPVAIFILLGDIIDRGDKQIDMLEWAVENISEDGKYQMIMGNHEEMKIGFKKYVGNYKDGYGSIYEPYYWFYTMHKNNIPSDKVIEYLEWMEKLPLYKDITVNKRRFILVHGGLSSNCVENNKIRDNLTQRDKQDILWNRSIDNLSGIKDAIIVHGHTPTLIREAFHYKDSVNFNSVAGKIYKVEDKYNIDCGIVYGDSKSNLAALNLNTLEEIYLYN